MEIGSWTKIQICAPGGIQLLPDWHPLGMGLQPLLNGEQWETKEKLGSLQGKSLQDIGHIRFH